MDCIFCKIINNEIPSYKLYEDDVVIAFLDVNPSALGHTLIIPKKHIKDIMDMNDDTLIHIKKVTKIIKKLLEDKLNIDGLTLIQNNGDAQEVKHFHLHLKPFYKNKKETYTVEEVYDILKKA